MSPRNGISRRALTALVAAGCVATTLVPTVQAAVPGDLTEVSCLSQGSSGASGGECTTQYEFLRTPGKVAFGRDGTRAYLVSRGEVVVIADRDPSTGALTPTSCLSRPLGANDVCDTTHDSLSFPEAVLPSRDGSELYVAGPYGVARVGIEGDEYVFRGCLTGPPIPGCEIDVSFRNPIALHSSGDHLYVVDPAANWIVQLDVGGATGVRRASCVAYTAREGCATAPRLLQPSDLAFSPDGRFAYATSRAGILQLAVKPDGALDPISCLDLAPDDGALTPVACGRGSRYFYGPLAVSPDGRDVYAEASGRLLHLTRNRSGVLTYRGCVQSIDDNVNGGVLCETIAPGLFKLDDLALDPDGDEVVVTDPVRQSVSRFRRGPDGALTPLGCIADSAPGQPVTTACTQTAQGIAGPSDVTFSPDGRHLLVSGPQDSTITTFERTVARPAITVRSAGRQPLSSARLQVTSDGYSTARITGVITVRGAARQPVRMTIKAMTTLLRPTTPESLALIPADRPRLRRLLGVRGSRAELIVSTKVTNSQGTTLSRSTITLTR